MPLHCEHFENLFLGLHCCTVRPCNRSHRRPPSATHTLLGFMTPCLLLPGDFASISHSYHLLPTRIRTPRYVEILTSTKESTMIWRAVHDTKPTEMQKSPYPVWRDLSPPPPIEGANRGRCIPPCRCQPFQKKGGMLNTRSYRNWEHFTPYSFPSFFVQARVFLCGRCYVQTPHTLEIQPPSSIRMRGGPLMIKTRQLSAKGVASGGGESYGHAMTQILIPSLAAFIQDVCRSALQSRFPLPVPH